VAAKEIEELIVGNFDVSNFEDDTGAIADEAMDRLAETDEVFAGESALYA